MDLSFLRPDEIVVELGGRLKRQRIAQGLTQAEVAARAGVSTPTISNLESGKNTAFETVVRVVSVLGLENELQDLFMLQPLSIAALERMEQLPQRVRHKRSP